MTSTPASRRRQPLTLTLVLSLVLPLMLIGCGSTPTEAETNQSVEKLYAQAKDEAALGNYDKAAKLFEKLEGRAAGTLVGQQAQLERAWALYRGGEKADALTAINRYIKNNPSSPALDYAYYLRGLINFGREEGLLERYVGLDMTQRDQAYVRQSFDDFAALIKRHPDSRYAPDARQRMIYLREGMAQADLNVALFYLRQGAYVASSNRAKHILETYDQTRQTGDALAVLVKSYRALGQEKLADDSERVLKLNYPQHPALASEWPDWRSNWWKLLPLSNRGTNSFTVPDPKN